MKAKNAEGSTEILRLTYLAATEAPHNSPRDRIFSKTYDFTFADREPKMIDLTGIHPKYEFIPHPRQQSATKIIKSTIHKIVE